MQKRRAFWIWVSGTATILSAGLSAHAASNEALLERAEKIQSEYVRASEQACDAGNLSSCEAADQARYGLNTFKTARQACTHGESEACVRVSGISPLIIQSANLACESIELPSCPGREVTTPTPDNTTGPQQPESSNPAVTTGQGAVIYNGNAVSGGAGGTPPPPH